MYCCSVEHSVRYDELSQSEREHASLIDEHTRLILRQTGSICNWRPFYEAQFGVEIFVELYTLRFHHQSPPKCC